MSTKPTTTTTRHPPCLESHLYSPAALIKVPSYCIDHCTFLYFGFAPVHKHQLVQCSHIITRSPSISHFMLRLQQLCWLQLNILLSLRFSCLLLKACSPVPLSTAACQHTICTHRSSSFVCLTIFPPV